MKSWKQFKRALVLVSLPSLFSEAAAESITAHTDDGMARSHQTAGLSVTNQTSTTVRSGRFDPDNGTPADSDSLNAAAVFPFLLPDHAANPTPFSNATFTFHLNSVDNTPDYNLDLYGIDARTASAPVTADFYFAFPLDPSANVDKLQDDIATPSSAVGAVTSVDITNWLNTQYASGANAGKYVFLRLTSVGAPQFQDVTNGYIISSADNATAANHPKIDYTLDTSGIVNYDVTVTYGANGTGAAGPWTVVNGQSVSFEIDADDFHHIDEVLLNGVAVPFSSAFTSPPITADSAIQVSFAANHNFYNVPDSWLATHDSSSTMYDPDNLISGDSPGMSLRLQSALADIDGDGRTAWEEYRDGTDPTDANSYLRLYMSEISGSLEARIDTVATGTPDFQRVYSMQQSDDLTTGSWADVLGKVEVVGTGSPVTHTAPDATQDKEFYRATVELKETNPRPPNIIMILTDDQGWADLAFKGHPYLKTPHLDRLAQEGTVFDNFYVGNPTCSPARAGFMTGRFPAELQIHTALKSTTAANQAVNNRQVDYLPTPVTDGLPNVASVLQAAGYATAHYGKWHLGGTAGSPAISSYGFDHDLTGNGPPGSPSLNTSAYWDTQPAAYKANHNRNLSTHAMVHETAKFIEENRDQPFYINIWANLPHTELNPTPEQLSEYNFLVDPADPNYVAGVSPSHFTGSGPFFTQYLNEADVAHPSGGTFAGKRELWDLDEQMQIYCASITPIDDALGVLLDKLEELGLAGNTIIMFTSDNGPEDYDVGKAENGGVGYAGPFRARKRSLYEGGIRVPCIVRWPEKVAMGKVDTESVWSAADWFPTVLSLADVPMPAGTTLSGEDVSGMLLGTSTTRTTPIIWEYRNSVFHDQNNGWDPPRFAIREGDYKLLTEENGTGTELYHLVNDPTESTNLINNAAHNSVAPAMKAKVMAWKATLPGPRN